jgi:hypothetical protein
MTAVTSSAADGFRGLRSDFPPPFNLVTGPTRATKERLP